MLEVKTYQLPEVVDQHVLDAWKNQIRSEWWNVHGKSLNGDLRTFIDTAADQMRDFGQIREFKTRIMGSDLLLCGLKQFKGETVDPWTSYELPVPYMVAVCHRTAMQRLYVRRGKGALTAFVKAHVEPGVFDELMEILDVHVFAQ